MSTIISGTLLLDSNLTCSDDIIITNTGKVVPIPSEELKKTFYNYHANIYTTANGEGRIITSTTGSITINGLIDGKGQGFPSNSGPGCNSVDSTGVPNIVGYGATHAGLGYVTMVGAPEAKPPYGNHETPVSLGSGSGYFHRPTDYLGQETAGGSAIRLVARSGNCSVNGIVNMNGQDGTYTGGASGGSIWITAWNIDGTGSLLAEGGTTLLPADAGGGGGGYISLWHERANIFNGVYSVIGKSGASHGKFFTKQIEPVLSDAFTGTILNEKWWDMTGPAIINNRLIFDSSSGDYSLPEVKSEFTVSGRDILATIDHSLIGDTSQYSAEFLLYNDANNWVGLARRHIGLFGISAVNGLISASGIPYYDSSVTLRIFKNDSTFHFQYYDSTSTPQTIYTDVRPELASKVFRVKMHLDKPTVNDTFRTQIQRLTTLDIDRQYLQMDGTFADQSAVALNLLGGSSQLYGLDFYTDSGDKVRWDSTGLSSFTTPYQILITDYIVLTLQDVVRRAVPLSLIPIDATNTTVNVVHGTAQVYGTDFVVINNYVVWSGLGMGGLLSAGDELRVSYYYDPWNIPILNESIAYEDVLRVIYSWTPPATDAIGSEFDNLRVVEGVIGNAETRESVVYVDSDYGSDSSDGRQLNPLQNLFVATAWSKRGGTVVLYDGTYNSTAVRRKDLTIRGAEGCKPLVTTAYVQDTTGSGWETNALSFYGCQGKVDNIKIAGAVTGIYVENGDFDIINNEISDATNAVKFVKCDPIIARNNIHDVSIALDFTSCRTPFIYSNIIYDSSAAVNLEDTTNTIISSNTFDNNDTHVVMSKKSSGIIANNNLTYASIGIQPSLDSSVAVYNNNFYMTDTTYTRAPDGSANNFGLNPLYYDRPNKDFHLTAGSPDIGTGIFTYDDYQIDFDGADRSSADHTSVDVGAFQYIDVTYVNEPYVGGSGNDFWNTGSIYQPFRTLDKTLVVADSTAHIDAGHYDSYFLKLKSQYVDLNQFFLYTIPPVDHFVSYLTLDSTHISQGYIGLGGFVDEVDPDATHNIAMNPVGGPTQVYGVDYRVEYGNIIWKDMTLENFLAAGDTLRILYMGSLKQKALNTLVLHSHYSNLDKEKAIFVSPNGSDSTVLGGDGTNTGGVGTLDRPYRTVTKALLVSNPGDNIVMIAGEYPMFTGRDDRIIVPATDRTSVQVKGSGRCYEDYFAPKDFRAWGTTEYDVVQWTFDSTGKSAVSSGGGFLSLTYDGTNTASAISTFDLLGNFEISADLRNGVDPIKLMVTSPDTTAYFSYNNLQYSSAVITSGESYICSGTLDGDATREDTLVTEYIQITADDVRNRYVGLSFIPDGATCTDIAVNVVGGVAQNYGEDFYLEDSKIYWIGMDNLDELEPGEVLRVIYRDSSLAPTVRANISLKNGRITIKALDGTWKTTSKRDMIESYSGPWKVSFVMDTPTPGVSHNCIYGKGYASRFLALADSFDNMTLDRPLTVKTEKSAILLYNNKPPVIVTDPVLRDTTTSVSYKNRIDASGGSSIWTWPPTWSWEVTDGTVPPGINFNDYQSYVWLDGTATTTGDYTFTVKLTDYGSRFGVVEKDFYLRVY